ncbi:hypothetical protein ODU10_12055, partial [Streptococcus suis]
MSKKGNKFRDYSKKLNKINALRYWILQHFQIKGVSMAKTKIYFWLKIDKKFFDNIFIKRL